MTAGVTHGDDSSLGGAKEEPRDEQTGKVCAARRARNHGAPEQGVGAEVLGDGESGNEGGGGAVPKEVAGVEGGGGQAYWDPTRRVSSRSPKTAALARIALSVKLSVAVRKSRGMMRASMRRRIRRARSSSMPCPPPVMASGCEDEGEDEGQGSEDEGQGSEDEHGSRCV
ncbi:hypothetical protein NUW58_g10831 [Xylaria curta]|uniref:Uncharacterized protein n=1 Tax=Xylaria curta TaxID=42375 RepID=A0ACC1MFL8_9PEZI|nr:hypothetical protein NUW58_g10831 [Xylaria curta]